MAKNAVDAMISAAVETAAEDERFVDGPDGHTQNKSKSGMAQVYTQQKVRARARRFWARGRLPLPGTELANHAT